MLILHRNVLILLLRIERVGPLKKRPIFNTTFYRYHRKQNYSFVATILIAKLNFAKGELDTGG